MSFPFPITTSTLSVLVTGANGGVGYAILQRLSDDFLRTQPSDSTLLLTFTVRSKTKATETRRKIEEYLDSKHNAPFKPWRLRIALHAELVDLTSLESVRQLAERLNDSLPKLDVAILNAGILGATGIDWPGLFYGMLTNFVHSISRPDCHIQPVGAVTGPQTSSGETLGKVFCANIFGHYLLVHYLLPTLYKASYAGRDAARIVWVSSMDSEQRHLNLTDLQGIESKMPYESSKAIIDILCLGSKKPAAGPFVEGFLAPPKPEFKEKSKPKLLLTHPGICATSIATFLPTILSYLMLATFYLARLVGSKFHNADPYAGATAMVWCALAGDGEVKSDVKYGSAVERFKREYVEPEDEPILGGEEAVASVWGGLEELRKVWEERLVKGRK